MTRLSRATPLMLAAAASALVGAAWFGLSMATGLLYHLMPGATFVAAAWAFRTRAHRRARVREATFILSIAAAVTAAGLILIPEAGGVVGETLENAIVIGAGFVLATRWMLRQTPAASDAGTDPAQARPV